ncbi:MAG: hypothetical protein ACRCXL_10030 [Dermatophilaceae bacterium]
MRAVGVGVGGVGVLLGLGGGRVLGVGEAVALDGGVVFSLGEVGALGVRVASGVDESVTLGVGVAPDVAPRGRPATPATAGVAGRAATRTIAPTRRANLSWRGVVADNNAFLRPFVTRPNASTGWPSGPASLEYCAARTRRVPTRHDG